MQLLTWLIIITSESSEPANSNGDSILDVSRAQAAAIFLTSSFVLFLIRQFYGTRRPIKLVDPHYLCRSYTSGFTEATEEDQRHSDEYCTQLRVVFKGRLLQGSRTVTGVRIKKTTHRWKDRPRGRRPLISTELEVDPLPDDGVIVAGQTQSKAYTLAVRDDEQSGLYWLEGDLRVVAYVADRHSRPKKLYQKKPTTPATSDGDGDGATDG